MSMQYRYRTLEEIYYEYVALYLKEHPGIMAQLKCVQANPGKYSGLTKEMLDEYISSITFKPTN